MCPQYIIRNDKIWICPIIVHIKFDDFTKMVFSIFLCCKFAIFPLVIKESVNLKLIQMWKPHDLIKRAWVLRLDNQR